jgi:SAM-dependent methyltransferase
MSIESLAWGLSCRRIRYGLVADITRLPFSDGSFDYVVSSEVLEHVTDDIAALRELLRVSRRGAIVTVPAHMYLWTDSDRILLHKRRYSKTGLQSLVRQAGGSVLHGGSYGLLPGILVLAYKAVHAVFHARPGGPSDGVALPLAARFPMLDLVNTCLGLVFGAELRLANQGLLPWGHSWWMRVERL